MRPVVKLPENSLLVGELPRGCQLCLRGRKSLVLITGLCHVRCPYCPLPPEVLGRDVVLVNDVEVRSWRQVLEECLTCSSLGVGISGGEPALVPERVYSVAQYLKAYFGPHFHIHIYTHARALRWRVAEFLILSCDEVRVHSLSCDEVRTALQVLEQVRRREYRDVDLGVEVPVFPGTEQQLLNLAETVWRCGVFLNLNELELTEGNREYLTKLGYRVRPDSATAVVGSWECGRRVVEEVARRIPDLTIHLCTVAAKERLQLRTRQYYRALLLAEPHEQVTDDGTLLKLLVENLRDLPPELRKELPPEVTMVKEEGLELHPSVLDYPWLTATLRRRGAMVRRVEEGFIGGRRVKFQVL